MVWSWYRRPQSARSSTRCRSGWCGASGRSRGSDSPSAASTPSANWPRLPTVPCGRCSGNALGTKVGALAANDDRRRVQADRAAPVRSARSRRSAGATSRPTSIRPVLGHLADRVAGRLRAKHRAGRTVTVRVRFAGMQSVTRSHTGVYPVCSTLTLTEIAERLVYKALADHAAEYQISLLAISVSNLVDQPVLQLELPTAARRCRAPRLADRRRRVGQSTTRSTTFVGRSAGRRSATRRWCSPIAGRCPTSSASSPNTNCEASHRSRRRGEIVTGRSPSPNSVRERDDRTGYQELDVGARATVRRMRIRHPRFPATETADLLRRQPSRGPTSWRTRSCGFAPTTTAGRRSSTAATFVTCSGLGRVPGRIEC